MYLQDGLWVVLMLGVFLVIGFFEVGAPFPGIKVFLVVGNLVGLGERPGVDGPFVFRDVDATPEEKI